MSKVYLFWDPSGDIAQPEAFLAPHREAAVRRFEQHVATAMQETVEETRGYLKGHAGIRAFIELTSSNLNYLNFRLAEVDLKEYK